MAKSKVYPLEIENVGEDVYCLMSRGHHDPHEFMRKVREDGYEWNLGIPEHRYYRAVPSRDPYTRCIYVEGEPGERGVFPVTVADEAYGECIYIAPKEQP